MSEANPMADIVGSPLLEADPNSLQELFDRVNLKLAAGLPEEITDDMLEPMVLRLRKQRQDYILNGETKPKAAPKPKSAAGGAKRGRPAGPIESIIDGLSAEDF